MLMLSRCANKLQQVLPEEAGESDVQVVVATTDDVDCNEAETRLYPRL